MEADESAACCEDNRSLRFNGSLHKITTQNMVSPMMNLPFASLPIPVALASVAVIGYLVGNWSRRRQMEKTGLDDRADLKRAKLVIRELESVGKKVRVNLATHHSSILNFKDRIAALSGKEDTQDWKQLCQEAESLLRPTMKLSAQIAHAYDEIRQQTNQLMTFAETRTDPLTGVGNRRALDESLASMFAMKNRYHTGFSIALFDLDHFKQVNDNLGHLEGDRVLKEISGIFERAVRETDIVSRFGGEEFVIVMPQTDLDGACLFCERLRSQIETEMEMTVSAGVAYADINDDEKSLLTRADSALYSAKTEGRNRVFCHTGTSIDPVTSVTEAADDSSLEEPALLVEPQ